MRASLLFYRKLRKELEQYGFMVNLYDLCIANMIVFKLQGTRDRHVSCILLRLIGIGCNPAMFGLALIATLPCLGWLACNTHHLKIRRESCNGHCLPFPTPRCTSKGPNSMATDRNFNSNIMVAQSWHDFFMSHIRKRCRKQGLFCLFYHVGPSHGKQRKTKTTLFAVDANNKIIIVHSIKNLGGTILNPANCYSTLIGNGCVSSAVIIDKASLLSHVNITAPQYENIISCSNKADIEALPHPNQRAAHTFHGLASFLCAPWLCKAILDANAHDPAILILAASNAAANFLTTNSRMILSISQGRKSNSNHSRNGHGELSQAGSHDWCT